MPMHENFMFWSNFDHFLLLFVPTGELNPGTGTGDVSVRLL